MPNSYETELVRSVRLLIPDTEAVFGDNGDAYIFSDEDIALYLTVGRGIPQWAAGLASLAIGGSEALIGKVIRNYETETDASKLMKEWTAKGKLLVEMGQLEYEAGTVGIFEIVYPDFDDGNRHAEGYTHPGYNVGPYGYQW